MELLVYKASAGSGKTFTLAVEYIKRLIENPYAYRQILAVTFTNKATTEMKERILQQLYGIWKNDPQSEAYLNQLRMTGNGKTPRNDEEIRRRAGEALQLMLHDYSRFRVETIDSFFQSVMRNLARELELAPNLNIELNNQEVLNKAVDKLIEELTPTSPVLAWLLDYINERIADDKRWNVSNEIKEFGRNIFEENYIAKGETVRQKLQNIDYLRTYKALLKETETEALGKMKQFANKFTQILDEHLLSENDLSNKANGISGYFRRLGEGILNDKKNKTVTLEKHLNDPQAWVSKSHKQRSAIINIVETKLHPLLIKAEQERNVCNHTVNSCRLSLQHLNKLQLLNHIAQTVRTLNHEQNRFLLSDTNALLHSLMREGDSSFVFEKTGAQIRTVMIDEFQDTSQMQWSNFRLLLLEGLSQGADSLIVGDVKQSIYRWRNGDWGILNTLGTPDRSTHNLPSTYPIRVETLQKNYRSEANIINFNNALFKTAVDHLNTRHLNELNEACQPLLEAYADVAQESTRPYTQGYVKAILFTKREKHEQQQQSNEEITLNSLAQEVKRLMEQGVHTSDIAILVRKKRFFPIIGEYFSKHLNISIVSDEAFQLNASPAVLTIINALKLISNPDDKIIGYTLKETAQTIRERIEELRMMPLYELLEELYNLLEINHIEKQEGYLMHFMDAAIEFLQKHPADIDTFLKYWDETLCTQPIPTGEMEGIRILSIHKAKGLEYHTVLIPFCEWKLENENNQHLLWCIPTTEPYRKLDLVPIYYSTTMADSVYRKDYLNERLQLWVDNLNLLYVALTRAGKNLILWGQEQKDKNNIAQLLLDTLPEVAQQGIGQCEVKDQTFTYELGKPMASKAKQHSTEKSLNRLKAQPNPLPAKMTSQRTTIEFRQSNQSADFIANVKEKDSWKRFINRGNLLHNLFSHIQTTNDTEHAITKLLFEGIISSQEEENEIRELVNKALQNEQVKHWYDGSWKLFNEQDIIWKDQQGKLHTRRPDRVMMRNNEIIVVDFKFGQPRKSHHKQVADYIRLLRKMGYNDQHITGHLWYVDNNEIITINPENA